MDQQRYRQQPKVLHKSRPSHSSSETDVTAVNPVSCYQKSDENTWKKESTPLETTPLADVVLLNKRKQHATSLCLTLLEILLLGFSIWFIYTEFISENVCTIASATVTWANHYHRQYSLASQCIFGSSTAGRCFRGPSWSLASRKKGVSMATFLATSKASSFAGVADLLRVPGWHRVLCVQKLVAHHVSYFVYLMIHR